MGGWKEFTGKKLPHAMKLPPGSAFDFFDEKRRGAIRAETLYTLDAEYSRNPEAIYGTLKRYVDAAADHAAPRTRVDLDPAQIKLRTVHVAVPVATSPVQWPEIKRVQLYGRGRGVEVVVTRIME